jgi:hypothetical protein
MNKLAGSKSVQEFTSIQSDLVREGLQRMVQDSRCIAETSLRAIEDASKTFAGLAQDGPLPGAQSRLSHRIQNAEKRAVQATALFVAGTRLCQRRLSFALKSSRRSAFRRFRCPYGS